MEAGRLPKSVRRIVRLQPDSSGALTPVTLYEKSSTDRKKGSRLFRPVENAVRDLTDAVAKSADAYAGRHRSSNRKRKDGWLRDLNTNMTRAAEKGAKRLKITRLVMP